LQIHIDVNFEAFPLLEGYPSLTFACADLFEPWGSALRMLKSAFIAYRPNFHTQVNCLGLSSDISSQITVEMCATAKNCLKIA